MHILPGYRGTYIWGYVLSGHCSRQQISGKNEGYLFSEGYLFTGFYGSSFSHYLLALLAVFLLTTCRKSGSKSLPDLHELAFYNLLALTRSVAQAQRSSWSTCHTRSAKTEEPGGHALQYSTVGCRRTGGRRSQPGSFLFFTTSANLVLILQSVFESRRLACSAQTVCDDACWAWNAAETFQTVEVEAFEVRAMLPKKSSSQQTLFACGEPFLAHFSSLGRSYF